MNPTGKLSNLLIYFDYKYLFAALRAMKASSVVVIAKQSK